MNLLEIDRPSIVLRVTDYIPQILIFIDSLVDRQLAYKSIDNSVYFDTQKNCKSFFRFTNELAETNEESKNKRHVNDFALWKAQKRPDEPYWESRYGRGRPGWHIECSTLANIVFGKHLDFHSGGKDLIFPHHENEILQCCAYHQMDSWSSFWLHTGHLHLKDSVKMSKSLKNTISIKELLKTYKPDELRFFCLLSSYRYDKEFTHENMTKPRALLSTFRSFIELTTAYSNGILNKTVKLSDEEILNRLDRSIHAIDESLKDDFNTCAVIDELSSLISFINKNIYDGSESSSIINTNYGAIAAVKQFVEDILDIFGVTSIRDASEISDSVS